ncbi:MAG: gliding motility protein GldL [Bacteroidetes bacterium]|nr:MAG: gliding motility protein GldL [Bacteroidota bacterium]MBL1145937.1 gliding motility protein GldL [Bacteroidota bacterium]NOG58731.1 gliding motility protein GldL [Bacteroidota bacterium]
MGIVEFLFETKKGKKVMGLLYGLGAAVVIIGALFKIEHWPGASEMLIVGLGTEALIFAVSAFEPPHTDVDWTLAYPELAGIEEDQLTAATRKKVGSGDAVSQELDRMLEEAKIGPELIESLGSGFKNLSEHTAKLNNISDASVATEEYVTNVKSASSKMSVLSDSYEKASETLTGLSISSEDSNSYASSLKSISSKLSELNNVYELQLKAASEHMESSNQAFAGMDSLMNNLQSSVKSTEEYKENITELAKNLSSLNTIYGNMLNAMNAGMGNRNNA